MKHITIFLLALAMAFLPGCAATRPVGRALVNAGTAATEAGVSPMEKLTGSAMPMPGKVLLWVTEEALTACAANAATAFRR